MADVKSRRDMYAEATRAALLEEATTLFAERGFAATSLDDVAKAANVTRGAVYHHFAGKQALFSAVVEMLEKRTIEKIAAAMTGYDDIWAAVMAAIDAFADICLDPVYSTVVWREGPTALGWNGLHASAEKYSVGLIEYAARALVEAGYFDGERFDTTVIMVFHLFGAAGMTLAEAEPAEKQRVRDELAETLKRMFSGLRTPPAGSNGKKPA